MWFRRVHDAAETCAARAQTHWLLNFALAASKNSRVPSAEVAELADALGSGPSVRKDVQVQVLSSALVEISWALSSFPSLLVTGGGTAAATDEVLPGLVTRGGTFTSGRAARHP